MSEEAPSTLQRILVALDASPHSRAALDVAIRLTSTFEAQVEGLFVEDETLLRTAQLPFTEEVRAYTSGPVHLNDRRLKRQLRYQAEYAEWLLQQSAEQADVPYDFQVTEGRVTQVLLEATRETDLLVLGKASTASSRRRLGTTSEELLTGASSHVLVLREALPEPHPILSYFDGTEAAHRAITFAADLARGAQSPLTILLPDDEDIEASALREKLQIGGRDGEIALFVRPVRHVETLRFSAFARRKDGLVILPAESTPLQSVSIRDFLYEIDRPLLVVR